MFALDVVTIFHALKTLEGSYLGRNRTWSTNNPDAATLFRLYNHFQDEVGKLNNLEALASTDWNALNAFLTERGFDRMFSGPLDGIGVVSILDMLLEWLFPGTLTTITTKGSWASFVGFEIPPAGCKVFTANGGQIVAQLLTHDGNSLWLTMPNGLVSSPMTTVQYVVGLMASPMKPASNYSTVKVPNVQVDTKPDIEFLVNSWTTDQSGTGWYISEAHQQLKFRMDSTGARIKVATGIGMRRGIGLDEPQPLVFDRPFLAWTTQPDSRIPIAIVYADESTWEPATPTTRSA